MCINCFDLLQMNINFFWWTGHWLVKMYVSNFPLLAQDHKCHSHYPWFLAWIASVQRWRGKKVDYLSMKGNIWISTQTPSWHSHQSPNHSGYLVSLFPTCTKLPFHLLLPFFNPSHYYSYPHPSQAPPSFWLLVTQLSWTTKSSKLAAIKTSGMWLRFRRRMWVTDTGQSWKGSQLNDLALWHVDHNYKICKRFPFSITLPLFVCLKRNVKES